MKAADPCSAMSQVCFFFLFFFFLTQPPHLTTTPPPTQPASLPACSLCCYGTCRVATGTPGLSPLILPAQPPVSNPSSPGLVVRGRQEWDPSLFNTSQVNWGPSALNPPPLLYPPSPVSSGPRKHPLSCKGDILGQWWKGKVWLTNGQICCFLFCFVFWGRNNYTFASEKETWGFVGELQQKVQLTNKNRINK